MKPLSHDIESRLWWAVDLRIKSPYRPNLFEMHGRRLWTRLGRGNA